MVWQPSAAAANGNQSLFPGHAHFYLWSADVNGAPPPSGSATNALGSVKDLWIDTDSVPIDVWQSIGSGGGSGSTSLLRLRFRRDNTAAAIIGNETFYLGFFIELRDFGPSFVGWASATVTIPMAPFFRYVDVSGNFLWPNVNASASQILVTAAPLATDRYCNIRNVAVASLAVTVYGNCNFTTAADMTALTVWPSGLPAIGVTVAPQMSSSAPPSSPPSSPPVLAPPSTPPPSSLEFGTPSPTNVTNATTVPSSSVAETIVSPPSPSPIVVVAIATLPPSTNDTGPSAPPVSLTVDNLLTWPVLVALLVTCLVLAIVIISGLLIYTRRQQRRAEQTSMLTLMRERVEDPEGIRLDDDDGTGSGSGSFHDKEPAIMDAENISEKKGMQVIGLDPNKSSKPPPTLLEQSMPINANPFGGGGGV
jgi:hypothetical protein